MFSPDVLIVGSPELGYLFMGPFLPLSWQISCSTASTELIDRSRFRRYFQLLQTMVDISDIYKGLINHYQWEYVSLITQNENLYTVVSITPFLT